MRSITRCPACETQFFVSEVQLNKHDGKVRCGQCLYVFDAKAQFVAIDDTPVAETTLTETSAIDTTLAIAPIDADLAQIVNAESAESNNPAASQTNNQTSIDQNQASFAEEVELSASPEDIQAFATETAHSFDNHIPTNQNIENNAITINDDDFNGDTESQFDAEQIKNLNDITKLSILADNQTNYFDDLAGKDKLTTKNAIKKSYRWLWLIGAFVLLVSAAAQSLYFLRHDIAIYYPNVKPYLVKACQQLGCSVNLPKQIEWIVIDDSDMQEDTNTEGVMHLSSRLINKAGFNLAYPNLELTLTDVEDNPTLRRVFKPAEYLPADTNIASGLKAGEEIKIKLAITTEGEAVAGYRIFVTY